MSTVNRAIKYRLCPTKDQEVIFAKTFGCCRKVWNCMLSDKLVYYEATGKMLMTTPARYKNKYLFLKEVDCLALCNKQLALAIYSRVVHWTRIWQTSDDVNLKNEEKL